MVKLKAINWYPNNECKQGRLVAELHIIHVFQNKWSLGGSEMIEFISNVNWNESLFTFILTFALLKWENYRSHIISAMSLIQGEFEEGKNGFP